MIKPVGNERDRNTFIARYRAAEVREASAPQRGPASDRLIGEDYERCKNTAFDKSRLYFEAHITIRPMTCVEDRRHLTLILQDNKAWRESTFVMKKDNEPNAFISRRSKGLAEMRDDVENMVNLLKFHGLVVLRWKIEDTLYDSNRGDVSSEFAE